MVYRVKGLLNIWYPSHLLVLRAYLACLFFATVIRFQWSQTQAAAEIEQVASTEPVRPKNLELRGPIKKSKKTENMMDPIWSLSLLVCLFVCYFFFFFGYHPKFKRMRSLVSLMYSIRHMALSFLFKMLFWYQRYRIHSIALGGSRCSRAHSSHCHCWIRVYCKP